MQGWWPGHEVLWRHANAVNAVNAVSVSAGQRRWPASGRASGRVLLLRKTMSQGLLECHEKPSGRVVKNGGHIYNLYGFPGTISKCTAAKNAISGGRGDPRQVYYNALVKMGTRYYQDRKKNVDWSPAGGWLQYGVNTHDYCNTWKCGPDDYAKYGRSSALGCKNTCSSFAHPDICKYAAPKCKWVPSNGWGSCKDVDQAELLQTTTGKTETADTTRNVKRSNELDRLLDDVQMEAKWGVGTKSGCW